MKLDESSIVASYSFVVISALVLRALLDVDGIECVTVLTICAGINGYLTVSKPSAPTSDDMMPELFLLLLLIAKTQRFFTLEKW